MSKLKKFTGFRGVVAFGEIGGIQFALVATTPLAVKNIWEHFMPGIPFDPAGTQKAVLVQASLLPETRTPKTIQVDVIARVEPQPQSDSTSQP